MSRLIRPRPAPCDHHFTHLTSQSPLGRTITAWILTALIPLARSIDPPCLSACVPPDLEQANTPTITCPSSHISREPPSPNLSPIPQPRASALSTLAIRRDANAQGPGQSCAPRFTPLPCFFSEGLSAHQCRDRPLRQAYQALPLF